MDTLGLHFSRKTEAQAAVIILTGACMHNTEREKRYANTKLCCGMLPAHNAR